MNKKHLGVLLITALLLLGLITGCSEPKPTGFPVAYGDVTLQVTPRRVVSLSPALTESLYTLGYGGRIVGVSNHCDRPSATGGLPRCGIPYEPDYETIYNLKPDLLLTSVELHDEALATFAEMGLPVITLPRADDMAGVLQNQADLLLLFAGDIRGPELAEQVYYYADTLTAYTTDSVSRYVATLETAPTAVYMARMDFTLATGDTLEGRFLEDMGLINQAGPYTGWHYPPEYEPDLNPDILFYSDAVDPADILASDYYKLTGAVTNERFYPVDGASFERQSVLMFGAMADMAESAFPAAFTEPRPDPAPPPPEEPEPEPKWYDFIVNFFK